MGFEGGLGVWGVRVDIRLALCSVWLIFWLVYGLCVCEGVVGSLVFFLYAKTCEYIYKNAHKSPSTHTQIGVGCTQLPPSPVAPETCA